MHPSSCFMGAGHHVPVMWVLAVDCPLVVDSGGAVLVGWVVIGVWVYLPYAKGRTTTMTLSSSLSSICVAWLSGCGVRASSFFVVAGRCVPVMWVLAVNCQWAVDGGGAVLVGWVVIGVVGLLTICKRKNDDNIVVIVVIHLHVMALRPWCVRIIIFRGCWSSCAGHVGASCQPPVGSRQWWCCVSGVGGNRCGGAAYHMQKEERQHCRCHPFAWHGSEAVACACRCLSWALVIVCQSLPLLCVGAIVVRWL